MTKLTWLSHGSWLIETGNHRVLLDPFLTDNPAATTKADDLNSICHILISHGHFDHVADAAEIANRNGATIVASYEIAQWFAKNRGVKSTLGIDDSVTATKLIEPKMVLPAHYNTWPPIAQDAQKWSDQISHQTKAKPVVLAVNETAEL